MSYDLRDNLLRGMDQLDVAANGIINGTLDRMDASALANISGKRFVGVATDIKARLAIPKIRALEAKLIESEEQRKLATPARRRAE